MLEVDLTTMKNFLHCYRLGDRRILRDTAQLKKEMRFRLRDV